MAAHPAAPRAHFPALAADGPAAGAPRQPLLTIVSVMAQPSGKSRSRAGPRSASAADAGRLPFASRLSAIAIVISSALTAASSSLAAGAVGRPRSFSWGEAKWRTGIVHSLCRSATALGAHLQHRVTTLLDAQTT